MLKVKHNLSQLKLYVEEKNADNCSDATECSVAVDNEKPSTSINQHQLRCSLCRNLDELTMLIAKT